MRNLLEKAGATDLNGETSSAENAGDEGGMMNSTRKTIGERADKRPPGSGGRQSASKKKKTEDAIQENSQTMVHEMKKVTSSLAGDDTQQIQSMVRTEVSQAMKETKNAMNEMKEVLSKISEKILGNM